VNPSDLRFLPAFLAGVASIVTPCVIGLFPVYLSLLGAGAAENRNPYGALANAVGFTLGFSLMFVGLGAGIAGLGSILPSPEAMRRIGGAFMVLMGLFTSGIVNISALSMERRVLNLDRFSGRRLGFGSSMLLGFAFSAGWTPCVGPVLASILAVASVSGRVIEGVMLLSAYSLGLALPFLVAAVAIDRFSAWLPGLIRASSRVKVFAGIAMMFVGVLYIAGLL
jgi:cytochrome c-type biogenesis protein